jgi:hypothetical protein
LVSDKVDRLQRSFKEIPISEELRMSEKLIIHFLREKQVLDKKANSSSNYKTSIYNDSKSY